ncbi:MAG: hypothetical protein ACT4OX_06440 [Actinomycetota bacterium]
MPTNDEIREQQRQSWDKFSAGWEKWDDYVLPMLAPVGQEMITLVDIRDDSRHLDVAAGTGEPGLTIAALAPKGRVVITDLAPGGSTSPPRTRRAAGSPTSTFAKQAPTRCRSTTRASTA